MKGLKTLSLLLLIVVLVGCAKQTTTQQVQQAPQPAAAPTSNPETPASTTTASSAPQLDVKCDVVAGIVPGSIKQTENSVTVTFKNNGRKTIEGSYFQFSANDKMFYRKNDDAVEPGKTISYNVDLAEAATQLGVAVQSFVVMPIEDGKACINQRMVVIK